MRTTLTIDDELLREAKERAARSGRTTSDVVADALRESFHRRATAERIPVRLPTSPGKPRPGVDIDNTAALLDLMEEDLLFHMLAAQKKCFISILFMLVIHVYTSCGQMKDYSKLPGMNCPGIRMP